jgi:hypothetical protein
MYMVDSLQVQLSVEVIQNGWIWVARIIAAAVVSVLVKRIVALAVNKFRTRKVLLADRSFQSEHGPLLRANSIGSVNYNYYSSTSADTGDLSERLQATEADLQDKEVLLRLIAHYLVADAKQHADLGQVQRARNHYSLAERAAPDDPRVLNAHAILLIRWGELNEAEARLNRIVELSEE